MKITIESETNRIKIGETYTYFIDSVLKYKVLRTFERNGFLIAIARCFSRYGDFGIKEISTDHLV